MPSGLKLVLWLQSGALFLGPQLGPPPVGDFLGPTWVPQGGLLELHPKIPWVRLKVWCLTPISLQRCRRRHFFSTPLQWECHFFTKTSRTAGTAPVFEASKLRLWLQRRAFWAQTGAVAAVWCPLSWASSRPPSIRRLLGPNIGPNFGHTEKWREEERSGEERGEERRGERRERERHG